MTGANLRLCGQDAADLGRLDPYTTDLDLIINTPSDFKYAIRSISTQIAGVVHQVVRFAAERVWLEAFTGLVEVQIPETAERGADDNLTQLTHPTSLSATTHQHELRLWQRATDRLYAILHVRP